MGACRPRRRVTVPVSELCTVEIESIASGGDGVARHNGLVVFVPRTAPGDVVLVHIEKKGRLARGVVELIGRPGASRVRPACDHYDGDRCGGCQLQHLEIGAQREAKQQIVRDAMRRIAKREVELPEMRHGTKEWEYRRSVSVAIRRDAVGIRAGFHAWDDMDRVFALTDCRIADPRLLVALREVMAAAALLPAVPNLRATLRLSRTGVVLVLEGGHEWRSHERFAAAVPTFEAIWWVPFGADRRLVHDRRSHAEPDASFNQVNPEVGDLLGSFVIERIRAHAPRTLVDAYAGSGDVAATMSHEGVQVTAIEMDEEAVAYCATRLAPGSRAVVARVEELIGRALPADVVLLNPPRAGVDAQVTAALEAARPHAILYVSCDPATLARDVSRLPSYRVTALTAFDMFPQTAHVETVCELVLERDA